jgi:TolB-like protein/DNA-binding winged helix-turn-helix (wHTH) protein/tetratricopeptide (TPR) repeat protein
MSDDNLGSLEFYDYRIDARQKLLLRGAEVVPLAPKVFDTLLALASARGRVVDKDDLLKQVWPGTFVEEGSLARSISTLRKILGDDGGEQRLIETIPKRGYRFVAPIRDVAPDERPLLPVASAQAALPLPVSPVVEAFDVGDDGKRPATGVPPFAVGLARRIPRRAVIAFAIVLGIAGIATYSSLASKPVRLDGPIDTIAVLPFLNLTADPNSEYIADGLTEQLIDALSNVRGLHVVSRTTVYQFKNHADDIRRLGRQLNVVAIIEGSVRRQDERIRVTVQLVNVESGYHYWSRTWDRQLGDVLTIQQDIAENVVQALQPSPANRVVSGRPVTMDREAYNLYLQAQFFRRRDRDAAYVSKAAGLYRQAIARDPGFAEAYVGLAILYNEAGASGTVGPSDAYPQAKAAIAKALELDPSLSTSYATRGWIEMHFDWDWTAAERDLRRAVDMDPNDAEAHHSYAHFLEARGRFDESSDESRKALAIDPLNAGMLGHLAFDYDQARQYAKAIDAAKTTRDIDQDVPDGWAYALIAYEATGLLPQAADMRAHLGQPADLIAALRSAAVHNDPSAYWRSIRDNELEHLHQHGSASAATLAKAYAHLGQTARAIDWIEYGVREHQGWIAYLNGASDFDHIRGDRRFQAIVDRVGLPYQH